MVLAKAIEAIGARARKVLVREIILRRGSELLLWGEALSSNPLKYLFGEISTHFSNSFAKPKVLL